MQTAVKLLLTLSICGVMCFLLSWYRESRPIVISGIAVNILTGRTVPNAALYFKHLNGTSVAARADGEGRFTVHMDEPSDCCALFVGEPEAGPLLGTFFTKNIFVKGRGERQAGVVVAAVPATQLSGQVSDERSSHERSRPLSGCQVQALTRVPKDYAHPTGYEAAGFEKTDREGRFNFTRLGADRYFVLARCQGAVDWRDYDSRAPSPLRMSDSWRPMLYPQAESVNEAQAIVLRPGDRVSGIDFQLHSAARYSVHGSVVLSDGLAAKPWPSAIYLHDLVGVSSDGGLVALDLSYPCDWRTPRDDFNCNLLGPGIYRLRFQIESGLGAASEVHPQGAEVRVSIASKVSVGAPLQVQLKDEDFPSASVKPSAAPRVTGTLRLQDACPAGPSERWMEIHLYGTKDLVGATGSQWLIPCWRSTVLTLPGGNYKLLGTAPAERNEKV